MDELLAILCVSSATLVGTLVFIAPGAALVWLTYRLQVLEARLLKLQARVNTLDEVEQQAPSQPVSSVLERQDSVADPGAKAEPEALAAREGVDLPASGEPAEEPLEERAVPPSPLDPPQATSRPVSSAKPFVFPSPERIAMALGASVGAFALLIGGLLGLVAVLEAGWFGPGLRVGGGLFIGTAVWVVAAALRGRVQIVPSALAGVAVGTLTGTLFAAHSYYELISPLPTFGLLVMVSGVAGLRATVHQDRFMAHVALIGGLMAPMLVSTGNNGAIGLFSYLFLLLCGASAVASKRRWPDLLLVGAAGSALIYIGWTATWRGLDSSAIALVAAAALSAPFAAASLVRDTNKTKEVVFRLAAVISASAFLVVALPWVMPIEGSFYDPRSYLEVVQSQGWLREIQGVGLALLPLPLFLAARIRRDALVALVPVVLAVVLTTTWIAGWTDHAALIDPVFIFAPLGPLAMGALVFLGARRAGEPLAALMLPPVVALGVGLLMGMEGDLFAAAVVTLTLLTAAMAMSSASGSMLAVGAPLLAGVLALAAHELQAPLWTVGPALVALGALSGVGLLRTWSADRVPQLGWVGALLIGPLLFPALHTCWTQALGPGAVGILPILVGAHGLLAALVLIRAHGVQRQSPTLALAVMVALGGVTFALPVQFQEMWLTVGWALEAAALAALTTRLRHPLVRWMSVALGIVVGVRLLLNPYTLAYGDVGGWPILNWTLYTWGLPTLCFLFAAHFVQRSKPKGVDWLGWAPTALRLIAMGTGFALVNVQVSQAFQDAGPLELSSETLLQGMVRSLSWASWGLLLMLVGLAAKSRYTRFCGFSFLMLAAGKVFVYDIWSLPGFIRVGSLLGLGVILIVSAFLFERLVLRESSASPQGAP